ncbi:hypothetical protein BDV36DRAFT_293361 [Aspergillus pseudocaelatus]|uniref:Aegerolysin type hemolysin n=1 Tax=Aspergillus pseudocaelatus TaxID=1825620 RepID=A0ABQ6WUH7_9EURO|nr:hypothetical protein BDV36DRAFT_293361 [Aspergillus pseudocaelatus]
MKITTTVGLLFTLLTTSASATPFFYDWSDSVTLQLSNDWSGANAKASVATDGKAHPIQELFDDSDLEKDGKIYATSAQLTEFHHNTICRVLQHDPSVEVTLDDKNTWSFLDRGAWVDVHRGVVICIEK